MYFVVSTICLAIMRFFLNCLIIFYVYEKDVLTLCVTKQHVKNNKNKKPENIYYKGSFSYRRCIFLYDSNAFFVRRKAYA